MCKGIADVVAGKRKRREIHRVVNWGWRLTASATDYGKDLGLKTGGVWNLTYSIMRDWELPESGGCD